LALLNEFRNERRSLDLNSPSVTRIKRIPVNDEMPQRSAVLMKCAEGSGSRMSQFLHGAAKSSQKLLRIALGGYAGDGLQHWCSIRS